MSTNPTRKDAGKSRVMIFDRKTRRVYEQEGFFGNFHETVWWARQNGLEVIQYTALA